MEDYGVYSIASASCCSCLTVGTIIIPIFFPLMPVFIICGLVLLIAGIVQLATKKETFSGTQRKKMTTIYNKNRHEASKHIGGRCQD